MRNPRVQERQVRLEDFSEDVLHNSIVVVLDCDMAICNDNNEIQLSDVPPKNGDGLGFLPKV
jgi:molybdopterin converting factor small subunit